MKTKCPFSLVGSFKVVRVGQRLVLENTKKQARKISSGVSEWIHPRMLKNEQAIDVMATNGDRKIAVLSLWL